MEFLICIVVANKFFLLNNVLKIDCDGYFDIKCNCKYNERGL